MEDRPLEDRQLLQRFVRDNSQEAFAVLTTRYVSLVYAVCRRELNDADAAEDVTQAVFLILARKAPSLSRNIVLSGWLFQTARFAAKNARLTAQRRAVYEQKAAEALMEQQMGTHDSQWTEIEPLLNQSLAALKAGERESVLLRFFQGASFAEVGASLGLSEDAARKRVTRSLDKMRQFFTQNGVIVPAIALPVLLTAHAAKAAPAACQTGVTTLINNAHVGHATAALTGSHTYQLSEGTLKAMKLAQLKIALGVIAAVVTATATYGIARGAASAGKPLSPIKISQEPSTPPAMDPARAALIKNLMADSMPSQYRTVALTGKVRLADGKPIGGIHLSAQVQNADMDKIFPPRLSSPGEPQAATARGMEIGGSFAHTRPDGTYTLYVGDGIRYNIYVVPEDLMKVSSGDMSLVAAAAEGVSGAKGTTVPVPDLVLTPGGIVTGTVTDKATGRPIEGATVMSYGPHRPESSAGVISAQTDSTGTYRLRVAPGRSRVYEADTFTTQTGISDNRYLEVAEGQTKTEDFQITAK